jgi:hypothetical protein
MTGFFQKLFGSRNSLEQLAHGDDRTAFIKELEQSSIYVFAAMSSDGLDPSTMTNEQLLAEIERAAQELNERGGFDPFVYEQAGQRRLPYLSSEKRAQTFAGIYSNERNRVYPFQCLGIKRSLLKQLLPACDHLVMNDRCPNEIVLTEADKTAM